MSFAILISLLSFSLLAKAPGPKAFKLMIPVKLVTIKNDLDKDIKYSLKMNLEETGKISELVILMINEKSGKTLTQTVFKASDLAKGIVLRQEKGMEVIKLSSKSFDFFKGGPLLLTYLVNGISKKYASISLELGQDFTNTWALGLLNEAKNIDEEKKILEMFFKSKKVFPIGTVGISKVDFKFAAK